MKSSSMQIPFATVGGVDTRLLPPTRWWFHNFCVVSPSYFGDWGLGFCWRPCFAFYYRIHHHRKSPFEFEENQNCGHPAETERMSWLDRQNVPIKHQAFFGHFWASFLWLQLLSFGMAGCSRVKGQSSVILLIFFNWVHLCNILLHAAGFAIGRCVVGDLLRAKGWW